MTKAEKLLQLYERYMSHQDQKNRDKLVLYLQPFIISSVHKVFKWYPFIRRQFEYRDLISLGNISVLRAIPLYDPTKNASLLTFLYIVVMRDLVKGVQYRSGYRKADALNFGTYRVSEAEILEKLPLHTEATPESIILKKDRNRFHKKVIEDVLKVLTPKQQRLIREGHLTGELDIKEYGGERELAKRLGVSYQAINLLADISLNKLKEIFRKRGLDAQSILD